MTEAEFQISEKVSRMEPWLTASPYDLIDHGGLPAMRMFYSGITLEEFGRRHPNASANWGLILLQTVYMFLSVGHVFEMRDCHWNNFCISWDTQYNALRVRFIDMYYWIESWPNQRKAIVLIKSRVNMEDLLWKHMPNTAPLLALIDATSSRNGKSTTANMLEFLQHIARVCADICAPYDTPRQEMDYWLEAIATLAAHLAHAIADEATPGRPQPAMLSETKSVSPRDH